VVVRRISIEFVETAVPGLWELVCLVCVASDYLLGFREEQSCSQDCPVLGKKHNHNTNNSTASVPFPSSPKAITIAERLVYAESVKAREREREFIVIATGGLVLVSNTIVIYYNMHLTEEIYSD